MLASLRLFAIITGIGIGTLTMTLLSLILWGLLSALSFDDAALTGLTIAMLGGFGAGGYASGTLAPVAHRFHGSVTGLGIAALVLAIARLGGSPAPTAQVLWLALLAVVFGGLGGTIAGRRDIT